MPTKESDEEKKQALEIDFDVFEKQIDDEIDRLFVPLGAQVDASHEVGAKVEAALPASGRPISTPRPESTISSGKLGAPQPVAERPIPPSPAPQDMSLGLRNVVPPVAEQPVSPPRTTQDLTLDLGDMAQPVAEKPAPPPEPPQDMTLHMRDVAQPVLEMPAPVMADSEDLLLEATVALDVAGEIAEPPLTVAAEPARKPVTVAPEPPPKRAPEPPPSPERTEIDRLVESLSVAYLSLEWDFSADNVARFEESLGMLAPYCQGNHEARSLYTILKAGLARMGDEPASVSPRISELIRDSQELLRDLIMVEGGPESAQKMRFKELIEKARALKNDGLLGRKPQPGPVVDGRPPVEAERKEQLADVGTSVETAVDGGQSLNDFSVWLRNFRSRSNEAAQKLQDESRRLLQVEQVLGRTSALAPVVARMAQIRSSLDAHVMSLRENDLEWERQIRQLAGLEASIQERLAQAEAPVEGEMAVAPDVMPAEPMTEESMPAQPEPSTFQSNVYSYRMSGKRFALLSSNVVKISKVSPRKANKIRDRGHATLAEFKPFLRNVKTGVIGSWSDISPQRLKVYEFLPLPYRMLRASGPPSIVGTAILVSNGDHHGIVFAEADSVQCGEEMIKGVHGEKGVIGVIETEKSPAVEVLNIDEILRELHGSSAA